MQEGFIWFNTPGRSQAETDELRPLLSPFLDGVMPYSIQALPDILIAGGLSREEAFSINPGTQYADKYVELRVSLLLHDCVYVVLKAAVANSVVFSFFALLSLLT